MPPGSRQSVPQRQTPASWWTPTRPGPTIATPRTWPPAQKQEWLYSDARALGFKVMVGCMLGTSLAMAPAVLIAQDADYVDLDGPLLLSNDRPGGLVFEGSTLIPPQSSLWG